MSHQYQQKRAVLRHISIVPLAVLIVACLAPRSAESAHRFKVLYSFCAQSGCTDGDFPTASLFLDQSGNLYGTTDGGGKTGYGTIFELEPKVRGDNWKFKVLHNFCEKANCTDGGQPTVGQLIADTAGNLYGLTYTGGVEATGGGTVFELTPNFDRTKWSLNLLYKFCRNIGCADGDVPQAGLTYAGATMGVPYDGHSPLYGVTGVGGSQNRGTVFELQPVQGQKEWAETVIYDFCPQSGDCLDGAIPQASLTMDSVGNLYGTTYQGGAGKKGTLFELTPGAGSGAWAETVLYSFGCLDSPCPNDGKYPDDGQLFMDSAGSLYGMTEVGGSRCSIEKKGCGVAYQLMPDGTQSQLTVLHRFCRKTDCLDGAIPRNGLIMDSSSNLYGTTNYGGGNDIDAVGEGGGTVFKFDGSMHILHSFCAETNCADGEYPYSRLIMNSLGVLFGTTEYGGANGLLGGTIFELTP